MALPFTALVKEVRFPLTGAPKRIAGDRWPYLCRAVKDQFGNQGLHKRYYWAGEEG